MSSLEHFFIISYFFILLILAVFGCHRYYLVYLYLKNKKRRPLPGGYFSELPRITVQLPMYNEMYVAARLIDTVAKMNYPRELLEIQVLDDSTDETVKIASERVEHYSRRGLDITYLHRKNRSGFKAGALEAGMRRAKGDFIAVFDADFMPHPEFLNQCINYFTEPQVGMVQVRWSHLNRTCSLITKLQSIFLDGHFVVEHTARNRSGRFFNFNGTAGIWRKTTISDAGGWEHDTLTEDLDLSYRAQLKGWKFIYLPDIAVPAELPADIIGFKTQQHRWAKGSIQTAKKLLPIIFSAPLPWRVKSEAFFHLAANFAYLLMIPFSLSILPVMLIRKELDWSRMVLVDVPLFLMATASVSAFYIVCQKELYANWISTLKYLPLLMGLGIGLAVNNSMAVVEALLNKDSEFVRTPKYGTRSKEEKIPLKKYKSNRRNLTVLIEIVLGLYFSVALVIAVIEGIWMTIPFLLLFLYGYSYMAGLSLASINQQRIQVNKADGL